MARDGGASYALGMFEEAVRSHLHADGLDIKSIHAPVRCRADTPSSADLVTAVVCSLGKEPRLRRTVESVLNQSHPNVELVVVDNAPATGAVTKLLEGLDDERMRIIAEPCPGLSAARNAGVAAARGSIIAFTDDDAFADPDWLRYLIGAFNDVQDVVAVTGLVVTDELETPAQRFFEEFGGFDKGFERTVWSTQDVVYPGVPHTIGQRTTLFPYAAGVYGSGNNMAFRAAWLRTTTLFDEALGAGSITAGGEDLDAFLTVMLDGKALVYEPSALVRHSPRRSMAALETQLRGYGSGNSAAITKHALASPRRALGIFARLPAGLRRMVDPSSEKNERRSQSYPRSLVRCEMKGFIAGPLLYLRGRREARRRRRAISPGST